MVCPGILNSNRLFPDLNMTRENIQFISDGYRSGALGIMYTAWDDSSFHNFISTLYGVAFAAEHSWNATRSIDRFSFEKRYCTMRFGKEEPAFLRTLDELMKFGEIGITYEMNDRIFYERFTPEPGKYLNINKEEVEKARAVLNNVLKAASAIETDRDHPEIRVLLYAVKQHQFIVESREILSHVSNSYEEALWVAGAEKYQARSRLLEAVIQISRLEEPTLWPRNQFTGIWLSENQSYCLTRGLQLYQEKLAQIERVKAVLLETIDTIDRGELPGAIENMGLEVREINSNYFPCWLFCGSFENGEIDETYLAYAGGEAQADPIPGERFTYVGQEYKWTRYLSENGFVMDFNRAWSSVNNGIAYATAVLYAEEETQIEILFGGSGENLLFCNGKEVGRSEKENEFLADKYRWKVTLQPGANRLILKSRQLVHEWKFSFRIDGKVVKSHKQKYYLY
ncbi:MAG: hypothetical protein LUE93_02935 [Bacteroides sp.]|nr:hypothetical protein [Bacteroides sp.]